LAARTIDNISTHIPDAATIGQSVWDNSPELQNALGVNNQPNWIATEPTLVSAQHGRYTVNLSASGIPAAASAHLFGQVTITYTITSRSLQYLFSGNDFNWFNGDQYNIGQWYDSGDITLADVKFWFDTHIVTGWTFNWGPSQVALDISIPGRVTLIAQETSVNYFGSVTFFYSLI
jgi:hypothetical protein